MQAAREQLILDHLPQVRWIAACIHERLPASISQEDLVSTGIVGLIQAIDRFDPARNASLRTYAEIRIRGAILDSIRGLDGIDPHKRKRVRVVETAITKLQQRNGSAPAEEEIAAELGLSLTEYQTWLTELRGVSLGSLDSSGTESESGMIAFLADPHYEDPAVAIERNEMRALLTEGIRSLPEQEQLVLDLYFRQELTLAEIGRVLNMHFTRASQIKVQAVLRLRSFIESRLKKRRMPVTG
ncbi:MAG: FliA/WhiG family RNA polymerase sigma factor [Bryobacteraceae bacterium]|nr:FliA/WhiG family RNA polymerase sigma factor [Bryobacteraceae bacterium]